MGSSALPGIEPGSPALGVQSLSHWTTRQVPQIPFTLPAESGWGRTVPLSPTWSPFFSPSGTGQTNIRGITLHVSPACFSILPPRYFYAQLFCTSILLQGFASQLTQINIVIFQNVCHFTVEILICVWCNRRDKVYFSYMDIQLIWHSLWKKLSILYCSSVLSLS